MFDSGIRDVLERLSAAIVLSDPSDLSALAQIKEDLGQIGSCAHEDSEQLLAAAAEAAARIPRGGVEPKGRRRLRVTGRRGRDHRVPAAHHRGGGRALTP